MFVRLLGRCGRLLLGRHPIELYGRQRARVRLILRPIPHTRLR